MVRALFLKFPAELFFGQEWDTPDASELQKFSLSWIPKILTCKSRASLKIQAEFFNRIGQ
jgi:hypothetical protein